MGGLSKAGPLGDQDNIHNPKDIYADSGSVSLQPIASF